MIRNIKADTKYITEYGNVIEIAQDMDTVWLTESAAIELFMKQKYDIECKAFCHRTGMQLQIQSYALEVFKANYGPFKNVYYTVDTLGELVENYRRTSPDKDIVLYDENFIIIDTTEDRFISMNINEAERLVHGFVLVNKGYVDDVIEVITDDLSLQDNGEVYKVNIYNPVTNETTTLIDKQCTCELDSLYDPYAIEYGLPVEEYDPVKHSNLIEVVA